MTDWREREVGNEARSREINEWIDEWNQAIQASATDPFVCECSDGGCTATICSRTWSTRTSVLAGVISPSRQTMRDQTWISLSRSSAGSRSFGNSPACRLASRTSPTLVAVGSNDVHRRGDAQERKRASVIG